MANVVVGVVLKYTAIFYAKGSALIGYIAAQQLAEMNGAQGIIPVSASVLGLRLGLFALGFSPKIKDTFMLPLQKATSSKAPLTRKNGTMKALFDTSSWKNLYKIFGIGKDWEWLPYTSDKTGKNAHLPAPTIWVSMRWKNAIYTRELGAWSPEMAKAKMADSPMFALAAAQCICGDVIVHNVKTKSGTVNQRPAGFGVGATAKLVPIAETASQIPVVGKRIGKFLHYVVWH